MDNGSADLGHDHNLVAGQTELFDGLAEYDLRGAIRVHLCNRSRKGALEGCGAASRETRVGASGGGGGLTLAVSKVWTPFS